MPPKSLASVASALSSATTLGDVLQILNEEVAAAGGQAALLAYDQRRGVLTQRLAIFDGHAQAVRIDVSLDHLPRTVQTAVARGGVFADVLEDAEGYVTLLGLPPSGNDRILALRGLVADSALTGILAVQEPRRRFGARLTDRFAPAVALFDLAYARLHERDLRLEAVAALQDVTRRLHAGYARQLAELQAEADGLRRDARGSHRADSGRVRELEQAAAAAARDAAVVARRLSAVEEQVASAVGRLERAHLQLHEQGEKLLAQGNLLDRIEAALADARHGGRDAQAAIEELLATLAATR